MAWESGFFNSVNGDRLYNADTFNTFFEGLITDGVFKTVGDKMAVQPNVGMAVQIATGKGFFARHWVKNTAAKVLELMPSDVTLNRYAAVIIKVDDSTSVRDVTVSIKYSELATNPVRPSVIRSEKINEYCLAYVLIRAGATEIKASDIEDTRFDSSLCGWVVNLAEHLDASTLYNQWEAKFYEWFNGIHDIIDEKVETRLVNALPVSTTVTIGVEEWVASGDSYTYVAQVSGVNETKSIIIEAGKGVEGIAQGNGTITFKCDKIPDTAVSVKIVHMGV